MKKIVLLSVTIFLLIIISCRKENKTMTVVKDCTGTYLRFNEKDYHICNIEKIASFSNGTTVKATYRKIKECNDSAIDQVVCEMLHYNEGWIEIEKIK